MNTIVSLPPATLAGFDWDGSTDAIFTWTSSDAPAIQLTLILKGFSPCGRRIERSLNWLFARRLLDQALMEPGMVGDGDVQIEQLEGSVMFRLSGQANRELNLLVSRPPLLGFMVDTYMVTPAHAETADVDTAILKILGGTS